MNAMRSVGWALLALPLFGAGAAAVDVDDGWHAFVIRENATLGPPIIRNNNAHMMGAVEFVPFAGSQKAALGTDAVSGFPVETITRLHVDRLDDIASSGSLYGPYFNIWITDGAGHYAVIANEPSDAEWAGSRWDVPSWSFLSTKRCKVYETPGAGANNSWVHVAAGKVGQALVFSDVAGMIMEAPPVEYILDPANAVSGGAPDVLGTSEAWAFNWMFGDTANNYVVNGGEGFVVANYAAETLPAHNVELDTYYATIQAAINAASPGQTIELAGTTIHPASQVVVNKALTLRGQGSGLTTIDVGGYNSWGVYLAANDISLQGITVQGNAAVNLQYGIHADPGIDDLTISDLRVQGTRRTGLDLNGVSGAQLSDIVANGATTGFGVALSSCQDVTIHDLSTSGNAWGAVGIYPANLGVQVAGREAPRNMVFSGTLDLDGGLGVISVQNGALASGGIWAGSVGDSPADLADVTVPGPLTHLLHTTRTNENLVMHNCGSLAAIQALVPLMQAPAFIGTSVQSLADGQRLVWPGLKIQDALNAASPGDVIQVAAGSYEEQLHVTTDNLTLQGAGREATTVLAPASCPLFFQTGTNPNHPVVYVEGVQSFTVEDLRIDGSGRGNSNYRFQGLAYWNSGGRVARVDIDNIRDTPFNGSQHGVALYANNNTGLPYALQVADVAIEGFQKNASVLAGLGLAYEVDGLDIVGAGPTTVTAQNGLQAGYGSTGTARNVSISAIDYTPVSTTACGVLAYSGGSLTFEDASIETCKSAIYYYDVSGAVRRTHVQAGSLDGIYAYASSAARSDMPQHAVPQPWLEDFVPDAGRATLALAVEDCVLEGAGVDDASGIRGTSDGVLTLQMSGNNIHGWMYGVLTEEDAGSLTGSASGNRISGNSGYGFYSETAADFPALGNWWGAANGPHHPTLNPLGAGDEVSDHVSFDPWLAGEHTITQSVVPTRISVADDDMETDYVDQAVWTLGVESGAPATPWRQVTVWVSWNHDHVVPSIPELRFAHDDEVVWGYDLLDDDHMELSVVITGSTLGQSGTAELFRMVLDGVGEPANPYTSWLVIDSVKVVDTANPPVAIAADHDGPLALVVDGSLPVLTAGFPTSSCVASDFSVTLTVSDNVALDRVEYNFDGGPWQPATGWATGTFVAPIGTFDTNTDHVLNLRAVDAVGYAGATSSWSFHKDSQTPQAPTALVALPAHHGCDLSWSAGSGHDGYVLYWKKRAGYPYPNGSNLPAMVWDGNTATADGSLDLDEDLTEFPFLTPNDFANRGVYDFVLEAVDCVNTPAASNRATATNYFLGDAFHQALPQVDYNGIVYSEDLAIMGVVYGSTPSDDRGRELNIGPTHTGGSFGLPVGSTPRVNFEDLIIFAMNYGVAGPELPMASAASGTHPTLRLEQTADGAALVLDGMLKGFSARIQTEAVIEDARAGFPVFFYRDGDAWVVDAVSLTGLLPGGSRVELKLAGGSTPRLVSVDGRDGANQARPVEVADASTLPVAFALEQNHPNPFNPVTTIRYALPTAAPVRLALYNPLGQQVQVLVQASQEAGWHEVRLDAGHLASGMYVYRIEAGGFVDQKKMILVK